MVKPFERQLDEVLEDLVSHHQQGITGKVSCGSLKLVGIYYMLLYRLFNFIHYGCMASILHPL